MNYLPYLPLLLTIIAAIWAYSKLTSKVEEACKQIDKKVNQDVCSMQHIYLTSILTETKAQLNRIEEKIDGRFNPN